MEKLTVTQAKVYTFIKDFIQQNGYSPTFREIGKQLGYTSTCTTFNHLQELKRKRYIDYVPRKPRTIKIL